MLIDLQLHSKYSDGYLTPTELASFLSKQGVKIASLTDHNTVGGQEEFKIACKHCKIKPITGLELYVKLNGKRFNLLWYNFDSKNPKLHDLLRGSQIRRRKQMRKILEKLKTRDFKIDINKILDKYNHYVPINHVVDDFIAGQGNLKKIKQNLKLKNPLEKDVIKEYFKNKKFGVLLNSYINYNRVAELRNEIGGQLILCHPAKHGYINRNTWEKLKTKGLDGIEILSPHHSWGAVSYIQELAKEMNLITTGGSDFHRVEGGNHILQYSWEYFKIDTKYLRNINKIIK